MQNHINRHFLLMPIPIQESKQSFICVRGFDFHSISTIFLTILTLFLRFSFRFWLYFYDFPFDLDSISTIFLTIWTLFLRFSFRFGLYFYDFPFDLDSVSTIFLSIWTLFLRFSFRFGLYLYDFPIMWFCNYSDGVVFCFSFLVQRLVFI